MIDFTFGYREVIPDQTLPEIWREIILNTGGTQSTLQDIKVAERSGGYCYKNSTKCITRNRFIYWRICHDILELVEQSLDLNLVNSKIRYKFTDTPILDGVSIHESYGSVIVLVPTVCSVHVLTFPHPESQELYGSHHDISVPSIFADASVSTAKDPSTFHVINHTLNANTTLPHAAASFLNFVDETAIFIMAYSTGSLLLVQLTSGNCTTMELKQESIVPRFLSGLAGAIRGRNNEGNIAVSIVLHSFETETFAVVLCRDGIIRIWSCLKGNCIEEMDILKDTADHGTSLTQGTQSHILRKSTDSDVNRLLIGIFLCFTNKCQFHIMQATSKEGNIHFSKISILYTPEQDLVDFSLDSQRIWAVWRGPLGERSVNSSSLRSPAIALWQPAILEPPLPREYSPGDSSIDPRQAYTDYIFYPGRFSFSVITKALSIYRRSNLLSDVTISSTALKERVCMAVEAEIQAEVMEYELSDDDYLEIANKCWSRFYSCCAQYSATNVRPLGLLQLPPTQGIVLLHKATISLLRPMEILEHLVLCGPYTNADQLAASQLLSNDLTVCKDILILMSILVSVEESFSDDIKTAFERELCSLKSPDQVVSELIEEGMTDGSEDTLMPSTIWDLCRKTSKISDLYQVMHLLLETLRLDKFYPESSDSSDSSETNMNNSIEYLYSSQLGVSTVTESVHQTSIVRFSICRNLLFLQHILLQGRQQEWSVLEAVRSVCMPDTVVFTQAYFTIVWLCETPARPVTVLEKQHQRLASLDLMYVLTPPRIGTQRSMTLLELFIWGGGGKVLHSKLANLQPEQEYLQYWHYSLLTCVGIIEKIIWPVSGILVLGEWLLASGQHNLLQQYVRQLSSWCEWNNFSRQFLLAVSFLGTGERLKALDMFQSAANGIFSEEFLAKKTLPATGVNSESRALVEYYLKVIQLLERYNALDCTISLAEIAISRADEDDPHLPTLHSIIFIHHLMLGHYEKAYHSLDGNPDINRRKDCLRQLIITLLDKREIDLLQSFPYVNMMRDFEEIVLSQARAVDPKKNFHYDFLYSFYITKGNFRKASTIMYEQAYMLSQRTDTWALEQQVKSYLACLNALQLTNEYDQFLVRQRPLIENQPITKTVIIKKYEMPRRYDSTRDDKNDADTEEEHADGLSKSISNLEEIDYIDEKDKEEYVEPMNTDDAVDDIPDVVQGSDDSSDEKSGCENGDNDNIEDELPKKFILKRNVEVITLDDAKRELAHVTARLRLSKLSPVSEIPSATSPQEIVALLLNQGLLDDACTLSTIFQLSYVPIIETLALICVRYTRDNSLEAWQWLSQNNISDIVLNCSEPHEACWKMLRVLMERYEKPNNTILHRAAANRIFALRAYLPNWLLSSYKKRNPSELIRLLQYNNRVLEASALASEYLEAALGKGKEYFGLENSLLATKPPLCLPINTLIHLLVHLDILGEEISEYKKCHDHLSNIFERYLETAKRVSNDMEKLGWQRSYELTQKDA